MLISRRDLLLGSSALATAASLPHEALAWFPHGKSVAYPTGWQVLPLGAGGYFTGFDIALDGSIAARSDVGGVYRFTGTVNQLSDPTKTWSTMMTAASLANSIGTGTYVQANTGVSSCYDVVFAPSLSSTLYAIFPKNGGATLTWALFRSTDGGGTWTQIGYPTGTTLTYYLADTGSNGTWRKSNIISVDPNNPNVVYAGMRNSSANGSGSTNGCYVATDGITFNPVTTNGVTVIGPTTYEPGCTSILFDPYYTGGSGGVTTTGIGGVTCTKRVMLPVSGQGIYESLDGGVTFTATDLTPFGRTDLTVVNMQMDANGTCYAYITYAGATTAHVWRYSGPGGVWESLEAQAGFPWPSGVAGTSCTLTVDPRVGHEGFMTIGNNGASCGYTSSNANKGTTFNPGSISGVTWGGQNFGAGSTLTAPSFDCPWLNHVRTPNSGGFIDASKMIIDRATGLCLWAGNQGTIWLWTNSDLVTPMIPNYAVSSVLYAVSTSRGTEATVAQDILCAPGAPTPTIAAQDVGVFSTSLAPGFYPTDFFSSPSRQDCETLEYAASDPSFYVGKVNSELCVYNSSGTVTQGGTPNAGYSNNFGAVGSWTRYTVQPDLAWASSIQGSIASNVLTVNSFNAGNGFGNVISVAGNIAVWGSSGNNPQLGTITGQLTGSAGGVGTYSLSGGVNTAGPVTLVLQPISVGGQIVAVDHDHHVACYATSTSGTTQKCVPVYTANATANPCSWAYTNLPLGQWMRRSSGFGGGDTSRPFAVGYGTDLGTVWAVLLDTSNQANIYQSADSGATWSLILTFAFSTTATNTGIYLLSVPGYPGELWLAGHQTSNASNALYHLTGMSVGGTPVATQIAAPVPNHTPVNLTLGAPQTVGGYPTFYGQFWQGSGSTTYLYQGVWNGTSMTWSIFGATGTIADLPPLQSLTSITTVRGDWNVYQRIYLATQNKGFASYNP